MLMHRVSSDEMNNDFRKDIGQFISGMKKFGYEVQIR